MVYLFLLFISLLNADESASLSGESVYRKFHDGRMPVQDEGAICQALKKEFNENSTIQEMEFNTKRAAAQDIISKRYPLGFFASCLPGCSFTRADVFNEYRSVWLAKTVEAVLSAPHTTHLVFFASGRLKHEALLILDLFKRFSEQHKAVEKNLITHFVDPIYADADTYDKVAILQINLKRLLKESKSETGPYPCSLKIKGLAWHPNVASFVSFFSKESLENSYYKNSRTLTAAYDFDDEDSIKSGVLPALKELCTFLSFEAPLIAAYRDTDGIGISDDFQKQFED